MQVSAALRLTLWGPRVPKIIVSYRRALVGALLAGIVLLIGFAAFGLLPSLVSWNQPNVVVLRGHEGSVYSAVFSPNGRRVVTASIDRTARIWDSASGKEIVVLKGHEDVVRSAMFSPDGRHVVTASLDKTARVWRVPR